MTPTPLIEDIRLHIVDGIRSLRGGQPDIHQAEFNFFEIADHLHIEVPKLWDVEFSHTIVIEAISVKEANEKAIIEFNDNNPRPDEMNTEVTNHRDE